MLRGFFFVEHFGTSERSPPPPGSFTPGSRRILAGSPQTKPQSMNLNRMKSNEIELNRIESLENIRKYFFKKPITITMQQLEGRGARGGEEVEGGGGFR